MDKKIIKSFEEFVYDYVPQEGNVKDDDEEEKEETYLSPDTQNPVSQGKNNTLLVGYPFGGL